MVSREYSRFGTKTRNTANGQIRMRGLAEGFGKSLGETFSSLTRSIQYELLQAIKKGECKFLDSFGKSVSSNFNYLDLELQDQILSLQEIQFCI